MFYGRHTSLRYFLWQTHIFKICSMADTHLQDMFYGRYTSLCSSGVAKDRAVQGRARHRLESGWSFRTRVWSLSTLVTNWWLINAFETWLVWLWLLKLPTQTFLMLLVLLVLPCVDWGICWRQFFKLNSGQDFKVRFCRDFEAEFRSGFEVGVWSRFLSWCFVEILKLNFDVTSVRKLYTRIRCAFSNAMFSLNMFCIKLLQEFCFM